MGVLWRKVADKENKGGGNLIQGKHIGRNAEFDSEMFGEGERKEDNNWRSIEEWDIWRWCIKLRMEFWFKYFNIDDR